MSKYAYSLTDIEEKSLILRENQASKGMESGHASVFM
jgi:hypothetical protein